MTYKIEFEDKGQDLTRLEVREDTGEILDAGLCSRLYADGNHHVIVGDLLIDRVVRFRRDGGEVSSFNYLMTKVSRDGEILASV